MRQHLKKFFWFSLFTKRTVTSNLNSANKRTIVKRQKMIIRRSRAQREEQAVAADPMEGKTVIGIDPGTNVLGYGVLHI